ncbi:MAG: DUF998 domain-containing protein [Micromonosporaceae bacterium]
MNANSTWAKTPLPRSPPVVRHAYGLGVTVGGLLRADPVDGFPPGTPLGVPDTVSWHGVGHFAAGGLGFLSLSIAGLVLARWFRRRGEPRWSLFSLAAGLGYPASFAIAAAGAGTAVGNLALTAAVLLGWAWITLLPHRADRAGGLR